MPRPWCFAGSTKWTKRLLYSYLQNYNLGLGGRDPSNISSRFLTLGMCTPLAAVMAQRANTIRHYLVDQLQSLALASTGGHFLIRWFAQILSNRTNVVSCGSAELVQLPRVPNRIRR